MTELGSQNPLQLAHSGYQDTNIFGTKAWGGSLDFNLYCKVQQYFTLPYRLHYYYSLTSCSPVSTDFCTPLFCFRPAHHSTGQKYASLINYASLDNTALYCTVLYCTLYSILLSFPVLFLECLPFSLCKHQSSHYGCLQATARSTNTATHYRILPIHTLSHNHTKLFIVKIPLAHYWNFSLHTLSQQTNPRTSMILWFPILRFWKVHTKGEGILRFILSCKSLLSLRPILDVSVWSDKCAACSINVWHVVQSVQCVVWSIQMQFLVHLQVQVQCVMYTVQCAGCSVLPAKDEDLEVGTGWVKLKFYLKK